MMVVANNNCKSLLQKWQVVMHIPKIGELFANMHINIMDKMLRAIIAAVLTNTEITLPPLLTIFVHKESGLAVYTMQLVHQDDA